VPPARRRLSHLAVPARKRCQKRTMGWGKLRPDSRKKALVSSKQVCLPVRYKVHKPTRKGDEMPGYKMGWRGAGHAAQIEGSGLAAGSEPSEASQKAKVKAQKAKVRTGLCLRLFWVGVGKGPPTSKAGPCYACFYGYHGTTWGRKSPLSCLARLYQPRTTKRPPQE